MKLGKHINRYNQEYSFTLNKKGNILWEGNFKYCRTGFNKEGNHIIMVDPSGGPYLCKGMEIDGKEIEEFFNIENGYEIKMKK